MLQAMTEFGNPSSVHAEGRRARAVVETAREGIARLAGARPSEVVFTSGAAESNAWVMAAPWSTAVVARIEHDSILAGLSGRAIEFLEIPTRADGIAAIEATTEPLQARAAIPRGLFVLQLANNETAVIQPAAEAAALAHSHGLHFHCDAVQAFGRIPVDFAALGVDSMSLSAHKLGGPKGIGALLVRDGVAPLPALIPGGQERRRRGGTENVAAIAGFGAAAVEAVAEMAGEAQRLSALRDRLERDIREIAPSAAIIGANAPRLPNTSCLALPDMRAESLVIRLDLMGISVSAGAACSSGKVGASHVLTAMGLQPKLARSAIRVSLGRETTEADVNAFIAALGAILANRPVERAGVRAVQ